MNGWLVIVTLCALLLFGPPLPAGTPDIAPRAERIGLDCGPFIGHAETTRAKVWARATASGSYSLILEPGTRRFEATTLPENATCVV